MSSFASEKAAPQQAPSELLGGAAQSALGGGGAGAGTDLRAQVAATQGYAQQRALVAPTGPSADVPGGPAEASEAKVEGGRSDPGQDAIEGGSAGTSAGSEASAASPTEDQDVAVEGGSSDASQQTLDSDAATSDPNSGMLAAGPGRGGGAKGRRGTRPSPSWPAGVPKPPSKAVWKKHGPSQVNPQSWYFESESYDAFREARDHNAWIDSLSKPQLDRVRYYRYCTVGVLSACRRLTSEERAGAAPATLTKEQIDKVLASLGTATTRIGAVAAVLDKALEKARTPAQMKALKQGSGVLKKVCVGLRGISSLVADLSTGLGLVAGAIALGSAAADLTTKGVNDETLKAVWSAAAALVKDATIAFLPPPIGLTLTVANAVLSEVAPDWVPMTVGVFFDSKTKAEEPKPKRKRSAPKPEKRGDAIANQINWR